MKKNVLFLAVTSAFIFACGGKKASETTAKDSSAVATTQPNAPLNLTGDVVCVWEGVPVYEEPNKKAKWMAGISLGETVKFLNEVKTDADDKDREYIKVELFDGKKGWAPSYGLVRDAKLGAVISDLSIVYKRPQLAAISDKKFKLMEIVAVGKLEGEFVEVTGAKKGISGWVKNNELTTDENEVTTAVLAMKMIPAEATGNELMSKMKEFLDAAPKGSAFYNKLNTQYNDMVTAKETGANDSTGAN